MLNDNFVVITKVEYRKGLQWFNKVPGVKWIISESDEEEIARQIEKHKAKIAVLGVEKYSKILYSAISKNAKPSLIVRYGVGYDGINLKLCRQNSIYLVNTPNVLDKSVAENTFALLLSLARNIVHTNREFIRGSFKPRTGFELNNKGTSNFIEASQLPRHRWYYYKEGFSPNLVKTAIETYSLDSNSIILDPFNGSGTVTLTASENNISSVGFEINPFTAFVSKTKALNTNKKVLSELFEKTYEKITKGKEYPELETYSTFTELSNKKHRPLGLGVQGLADCFFKLAEISARPWPFPI